MDIEKIRDFCLSLPGTSEGIKYGDLLCFMVAGKAFCSAPANTLDRVSFKVGDEEFEVLCDRPGLRAAPYGGAKFKWIQVTDFDGLETGEWTHYLRQAYELVKAKLSKKVQASILSLLLLCCLCFPAAAQSVRADSLAVFRHSYVSNTLPSEVSLPFIACEIDVSNLLKDRATVAYYVPYSLLVKPDNQVESNESDTLRFFLPRLVRVFTAL